MIKRTKEWFSDHFPQYLIIGGLVLALFAAQVTKYFFDASFREAITTAIGL
jgi:3-hydroxymyristoyl/3-hydroxydecanoyl-(acyl carrier protein) dehydratase